MAATRTRTPKRSPIVTDKAGVPHLEGTPLHSGDVLEIAWPDGVVETARVFTQGGTLVAEGDYHGTFAYVPLQLRGITARRSKYLTTQAAKKLGSPQPPDGGLAGGPLKRTPSPSVIVEEGKSKAGTAYTIRSNTKTVEVFVLDASGPKPLYSKVAAYTSRKRDVPAWFAFVIDVFRQYGILVAEVHMPIAVWRAASGTPLSGKGGGGVP
jgi:hypothetical protein